MLKHLQFSRLAIPTGNYLKLMHNTSNFIVSVVKSSISSIRKLI